ncbi:MAG: hypothetical protein UY48_C0024G0006 [Candidatus Gottesmanbacteria bacterium GW2011_GWB1_49_7]|uniref:Uncharacterized protein n=1 Tax=Candidatus Gottesmanbacteria bacterium GW2011_GWB1_49_7 TaxID=1618448 RepID=A0A0G1VXX4_9BACT|nr:MAG: hypothetical protein UY48_C0024G0006 [Candidatus Gottesmanbacteria bacterium GW2011_GWB1_49_7]
MLFKLISSKNTVYGYRENEPFTFHGIQGNQQLPFELLWQYDREDGYDCWYYDVNNLDDLLDLLKAIAPNQVIIDYLNEVIEIYDGWRE